MKSSSDTTSGSHALRPSPLAWTDLELLEITRSGMRFRSHHSFDLGDTLSLGVHLHLGTKGSTSDFLKIEGSVIECRVSSWGTSERLFEITLLFQAVDEDEKALLLYAMKKAFADSKRKAQPAEPFKMDDTGWLPVGLN